MTTANLTDGSANVTASYGYDVFGALRPPAATTTPFLFTGEQRDSGTSLYYLRARYYEPATGRFLGQDPVPANNLYAYVGNNPVNLVDPLGLCAICDWIEDRDRDVVSILEHTAENPNTILNGGLVNETLAGTISAFSSCDRDTKEGGVVLYTNCGGLAGWISNRLLRDNTYTVGSFIFSPGNVNPELLRHEMAHVTQYDVLGITFLPIYETLLVPAYVSCGFDAECTHSRHPLEWIADKQAGTNVR